MDKERDSTHPTQRVEDSTPVERAQGGETWLLNELVRRLSPMDPRPVWKKPSAITSITSVIIALVALTFSIVSFYRTLPAPASMHILAPKRMGVEFLESGANSGTRYLEITPWVPFVNDGGQSVIVTNTVLVIADLDNKREPLLFEQYDSLPADFSPKEAKVLYRVYRNGPYIEQWLRLNEPYEVTLLGFTDDSNQPTFGIRFLADFIAYTEAASFIDVDYEYDGLLKLKRKFGAFKPGLLTAEEIELIAFWMAPTIPRSLLRKICNVEEAER